MVTFTSEQIEAGLADTRINDYTVTELCDRCNTSFSTVVIPLPPKRCLHSNYVPSPPEITEISSDYREERDQMKVFDAEITRLRTVLGRLTDAKRRLLTRMFRRKAALSIARRVPAEIWRMIFTWASTSRQYSLNFVEDVEYTWSRWQGGSKLEVISLPHTLSRVCRHWQKIVVTHPFLWSSIRIKPSILKTDIRPLLMEYLEKSCSHPLVISCVEWIPDSHHSYDLAPHEPLTPIQEQCFSFLMNEMASRCEELELRFAYNVPESAQQIELPNLRSFQSDLISLQDDNIMWLWLRDNLGRAAHLTHLSMHDLPNSPPISTKNLQYLEIQVGYDGSHFRKLLQGCVNLECLIVRNVIFPPTDSAQIIDDIHLPRLRHLSLASNEEPLGFSSILDALTAPCLLVLALELYMITPGVGEGDDLQDEHGMPFPQESFTAMLKRHSSCLRDLRLTICRDIGEPVLIGFSLREILQAVPRLTRFVYFLDVRKAIEIDGVETLISSLQYSVDSSDDALVPRLEEVLIILSALGEESESVKERSASLGTVVVETSEFRYRTSLSGDSPSLKNMWVVMADEHRLSGKSDKKVDLLNADPSLSERTKALESDGTTCFFGSWSEFSSRFGDEKQRLIT